MVIRLMAFAGLFSAGQACHQPKSFAPRFLGSSHSVAPRYRNGRGKIGALIWHRGAFVTGGRRHDGEGGFAEKMSDKAAYFRAIAARDKRILCCSSRVAVDSRSSSPAVPATHGVLMTTKERRPAPSGVRLLLWLVRVI